MSAAGSGLAHIWNASTTVAKARDADAACDIAEKLWEEQPFASTTSTPSRFHRDSAQIDIDDKRYLWRDSAMGNEIISFFRGHRDGEGQEACSIVADVRCAAPSRELLWIDEHLFDGNALRNEFFKALVGRDKPLFEGVEQLRFVRDEVTDRLVVLGGAEPRLRYRHSSHDKFLSAQRTEARRRRRNAGDL
jgi:hypothetical protein